MSFNASVIAEITSVANRYGWEPAALIAIAAVESGGIAFALVGDDNKREPVIRWEGHYFDRRLTGADQRTAREKGLASPKAGAIPNPSTQAARWRLLDRAVLINANAAYESVSYGVGQVMGAHWAWLGFNSVTEMVNLCRSGVAGQVDVMARYIDKAGLAGALKAHNWHAFARGYNGPNYQKYGYHTLLAKAYEKYAGTPIVGNEIDRNAMKLQQRLTAHGFPVKVDGIIGPETFANIEAFQHRAGLVVDGIAGSATWKALDAQPEANPAPAAPSPPPTKPHPQPPVTTTPPPKQGWWAWLRSWF